MTAVVLTKREVGIVLAYFPCGQRRRWLWVCAMVILMRSLGWKVGRIEGHSPFL